MLYVILLSKTTYCEAIAPVYRQYTDTFRMKSSEKKNLQHRTGRKRIISSLSSIFCSLLLNNSNLSEYQLKRKEATKRGLKKKKASKCYISIIINRKSIAIGMIPKKKKKNLSKLHIRSDATTNLLSNSDIKQGYFLPWTGPKNVLFL